MRDRLSLKRVIGGVPVVITVLALLMCAFGSETAAQDRRHSRAGEKVEPILEIRWGRDSIHQHVNAEMVERYGANRVWHGPGTGDKPLAPAEEANREFHHLQKWGIEVTVAPGSIDEERWLEEKPEWASPGKSIFLHSRPVEAEGEELRVRLLDGHAADRVNFDIDPDRYWRVVNMSTDEMVPGDRWEAEPIEEDDGVDGEVVISGTEPGDRYMVVFAAGGGGRGVDKMLPEVQQSEEYFDSHQGDKHVGVTDADYSRSIHVAGFGHHIVRGEEGRIQDWFTYGKTLTPTTMEYFEEQTGREVDPMWWINEQGEVRTSDDPPPEGYLEWIDTIQEQVIGYARGYTDWVHRNDAEAAVFWGDGFTGMEPYRGMMGEAGYDWVTMPTNWSIDARRLTDFEDEHDVDRTIRIWVHSRGAFNQRWDSIRRAVLYKTPDGVSIGSQNADYHEEKPGYAEAVKQALREFDRFYRHMDGTEPFSHDLKLYVINAWGKFRAWPRSPWVNNPSQTTLMELTDLPIDVQFLSLREVADEGVPADADVLLNVGEPGSAWSGGFHWNERVASAIREYVEAGGGLIGIDAPAIDGDDQFLLPEVFGLRYDGRVSKAAEQELYRGNAGLFRDYESPPKVELRRTGDAPRLFAGLDVIGTVQRNVAMEVAGEDVEVFATDEEGKGISTLNTYGSGRAAYITGNQRDRNYGEYLKRLIYHVAGGGEELMQTFDSPTPGGHVYLYPEADVLFVYNRSAPDEEVTLLGKELAERYGGDRIGLRCIYHGHQREPSIQDMRVVTGRQLSRGVTFEVPDRSLYIYRIVEDPHENWPFGD